MILAVTHPADEHARPVLEALARLGAEAVVLDLSELPRRGRLALGYGASRAGRIELDGRPPVDADRIRAVWWRRARRMVAAEGLSIDRADFSVRQANDALMGLIASLGRQALLVNDPWREAGASYKTGQLAAAERSGLLVPRTLVTSDPGEARAFLDALGGSAAIHKAVHATPADWRRTRRIAPEDLQHLDALRFSTVILQEHVPGVDVRVTVVGESIFAAEIDARSSSSPDDYRGHEPECRIEPCPLPAAEERALRMLVRDLGLQFAAVDFRRRDDGAWFFLELNPAGQWDFVEERTGLPITEALAGLLASAGVPEAEPAAARYSPGISPSPNR